MPRRPAMRIVSSCEHATHSGGCGFWRGFGITLRSGKSKCSPWYSHASFQNIGSVARTASSHTDALVAEAHVERVQLGGRGRLAEPELDPAVRHEVERRHPLGHARRVVGRELDDPVAEPDAASCAGWPRRGTPRARELWLYSSRKWCSTSHA